MLQGPKHARAVVQVHVRQAVEHHQFLLALRLGKYLEGAGRMIVVPNRLVNFIV
ncbi:hypothetical protein ACF8R4_17165 [Pseudomonas sp. FYR_2]|uniref:Uncharacterized protein n=1 Tax=Pseudomonas kurunegalensis TaxID=485880 RepID=A0ACC5UJZ2_9PSED|nr:MULTISPECIES: hypothetical protein [Pseudomonas]MBA6138400.1 hypothetical protein [Pseudomonas monteilii]MBV4514705.1 hypothetical protein [Pseudomonas kurunegalensis]MCA4078500.1 hypothetical protein [Pseudomonas kurunegalensis]MCE0908989.1 hypothetical protein [Pseudomonas kurunegalensis]MDT3747510.1 hypothetical protein [Pseudomonas kurunegalensis]